MKVVLPDTNVLSELFRANPEAVEKLGQAERIVISPIVEGELLGGFQLGSKLKENLAVWSSFLNEPFVEKLPLGGETADRYSRLWAQLRRKGTPIPSNDIWIAAQAGELGVEFLSFDEHFERIDGLVWTFLERRPRD